MSECINDYPAIKHANTINDICQPLFDMTPISVFCLNKIHKFNEYTGLYSDQDLAKSMINNRYFESDAFTKLAIREPDTDFILWSASNNLNQRNGLTKDLFMDLHERQYQCGITVIEKHGEYHQSYCFGCPNDYDGGDEYLLDNLHTLKLFIMYFKEVINKDSELTDSLEQGKRIPMHANTNVNFATQNKANIINFNLYILNKKINETIFTQEELEFLDLVAKENTPSDIASKLFLTNQDIKNIIIGLKDKTGARNKRELLKFYLECSQVNSSHNNK